MVKYFQVQFYIFRYFDIIEKAIGLFFSLSFSVRILSFFGRLVLSWKKMSSSCRYNFKNLFHNFICLLTLGDVSNFELLLFICVMNIGYIYVFQYLLLI